MIKFIINENAIKKAWDGSGTNLFSLKTNNICDACELADVENPIDISQSAFLLNLGYIPYVSVNDCEVIHAYVETLNNEKLKQAIDKVEEESFVDSFWKYFNIYPDIAEGYSKFENDYVTDKIVDWCDANGIQYQID